VLRPSGDGYEATPFAYIALTVAVIAGSDSTPIDGETNAVVATCVQLEDVCPSVNTADARVW
jgi:hypothetical protein